MTFTPISLSWYRRLTSLALTLLLTCVLASSALASDPDAEIKQAIGGASQETWQDVGSTDNYIDSRAESTYSLINASGETWRQIRNTWVSPGGAIAILGMLAVLVVFYLIVGRKTLDEPLTGRMMLRWTALERALHWTMATLFILLALTGLNLLFGKLIFRPLFGDGFWAPMIAGTKLVHNYLGPLFSIVLILVLAKWLTINIPKKHDWTWFKQGGGVVGNAHPDAGFANGGEKAWYWLLASAGLVVVVTGLIMDFPIFGQSRDTMQWMNVLHGIGSLGLTAVALGHIYIGTLGMEGAFSAMKTGYVDEAWAKQHHNLWYEEVMNKADAEPKEKAVDDGTAKAHRPN
ncbi:formate dehydrogenase subunit gamma [Halomonas sp. PR-M31]|uniref:formate dehydrogenase subunit gamma n=1 Tax=Halomonas sp. PR-M31 TaxID=1471202 RepID=UPI00069EC66A|nr:formate dehydrogenase subunit gamma [Halomonas sp. PR-M31]